MTITSLKMLIKLVIAISVIFISLRCDNTKNKDSSKHVINYNRIQFLVDNKDSTSMKSSDFSLNDYTYDNNGFRFYTGQHPDLLSESRFLLIREPHATYSKINFINDSITFYKLSEEIDSISLDKLQDDSIKVNPRFLKYAIYYLRRDSFTVWLNIPLKRNELQSEIIVQNLEDDSRYEFNGVFYFNNTIKDSTMIFNFAKEIK